MEKEVLSAMESERRDSEQLIVYSLGLGLGLPHSLRGLGGETSWDFGSVTLVAAGPCLVI